MLGTSWQRSRRRRDKRALNVNDVHVHVRKFSQTPGPRHKGDGPDSGQAFREEVLFPKFMEAREKGGHLVIVLDGTAGYGSSFLEEAFGGLVRAVRDKEGMSVNDVKRILEIKTVNRPWYKPEIADYIERA